MMKVILLFVVNKNIKKIKLNNFNVIKINRKGAVDAANDDEVFFNQ